MAFCKLIIISTILPMSELLDRLDPSGQEDRKQFRRRCKLYIEVTEVFLTVKEYDFTSDTYVNETLLMNPIKDLVKQTAAAAKMTPQQISSFLAIPLLPDEHNPIVSKQHKGKRKPLPPPDDVFGDYLPDDMKPPF